MMLKRLFTVSLIVVLATCAGGRGKKARGGATAKASGGGTASIEGTNDDGTPKWIIRGSAAVTGEGGRAFYGVGIASGINNPALLRSTADNRARAEIGKLFHTFSASLMKDYMNSEGEQAVEQAIKTMSSMALKGVQIVDHYIAGDGKLFALAKLDMATVQGVLKAEELGAAKSHTTKVDTDDIFDKHSKKEKAPPPPPPVKASGDDASAGTPPPKASSGAQTAKTKPAWVDGADDRFPRRSYLCAVGFGRDRTAGENGAFAAMSRIFIARVQSVSKDFMGAYSKTGAETLEVQSSSQLNKVSTEKILSGVEIPEIWNDGKASVVYALACLERGKVTNILREQIAEADDRAGRHLERAHGADKASRVRELAQALDALVQRAALNGELRIVDADGIGVAGEYSHVDVAAAFEEAVEALKVGVSVEGRYDDDFRSALIEGLSKLGFKVSEGLDGQLDVSVEATIRIEDGGKGTGRFANNNFARAVIIVEVKNVAKGTVLGSFNENRKEGHRNLEEAERRAVRNLAKKLTTKVGKKIEKAMLR